MTEATNERLEELLAHTERDAIAVTLVRDVARIADGIGAIHELAIKLAPASPAPERPAVNDSEMVAIKSLLRGFDLAVDAGVSTLTIARADAGRLISVLARLGVRP